MLRLSYYKVILALLLIPVLSCSQSDSPPPASNTVIIRDNSYSPLALNVVVGRVVVWRNDGANRHTVTSGTPAANPGALFNSGVLNPGGGFTFTFSQPGQYPYFCLIHGAAMSGVINAQ